MAQGYFFQFNNKFTKTLSTYKRLNDNFLSNAGGVFFFYYFLFMNDVYHKPMITEGGNENGHGH